MTRRRYIKTMVPVDEYAEICGRADAEGLGLAGYLRVVLTRPMRSESGEIIGYEEQSRGGAIIRDINGRSIGSKFTDLRSRKSLTIVFRPADAPKVAVSQPKIWELMASLTNSDLRRIQ